MLYILLRLPPDHLHSHSSDPCGFFLGLLPLLLSVLPAFTPTPSIHHLASRALFLRHTRDPFTALLKICHGSPSSLVWCPRTFTIYPQSIFLDSSSVVLPLPYCALATLYYSSSPDRASHSHCCAFCTPSVLNVPPSTHLPYLANTYPPSRPGWVFPSPWSLSVCPRSSFPEYLFILAPIAPYSHLNHLSYWSIITCIYAVLPHWIKSSLVWELTS